MAKRKAAKASGRKKKAAKRGGSSRPRRAAARASTRKGAAKKATKAKKKSAAKRARPVARKAARKAPKRVAAKKAVARKASARKTAARKAAPRRSALKNAPKNAPKKIVARKSPALNRARRTVTEEELLPSPPSSLDMDRTASAARSGRRELRERLDDNNEGGATITAGDVDADWESAYSTGDEAPGGDNPTPDQDVVDDIGKALGVQYEDNEELKGEKKISDRDKNRWELDPASAEDYPDHET